MKVSRLIFGTATYGVKSDVAWRVEKEEALTHLQVRPLLSVLIPWTFL